VVAHIGDANASIVHRAAARAAQAGGRAGGCGCVGLGLGPGRRGSPAPQVKGRGGPVRGGRVCGDGGGDGKRR
jgi:hypothetical protein